MQVRDKLYTTREMLHFCLVHSDEHVADTLRRSGGYTDTQELLDTLTMLYRSLKEIGALLHRTVTKKQLVPKTKKTNRTRSDCRVAVSTFIMCIPAHAVWFPARSAG